MGRLRFHNINSSKAPEERYLRYLVDWSWVNKELERELDILEFIDVYFVNENTMDKISPPEGSCGIPVEKLREVGEMLSGLFERRDRKKKKKEMVQKKRTSDLEDLDKKQMVHIVIDELKKLCHTYAPLGAFLAPTSYTNTILVNGKTINLPAIVMCPERIHKKATKISRESNGWLSQDEAFRLLMRNVLAHEQAHALSWKKSSGKTYQDYSQVHVRILEETLAQLVALSDPPKRETEKYEYVMLALSKEQPVEYNIWKILAMPIDAGICYVNYPGLLRKYVLFPEDLLYYDQNDKFWELVELSKELLERYIFVIKEPSHFNLKVLALRLLYVYTKYEKYMYAKCM